MYPGMAIVRLTHNLLVILTGLAMDGGVVRPLVCIAVSWAPCVCKARWCTWNG